MITLYGVDISNFVTKVVIALEHKGLSYERKAPPGGSYRSAEYKKLVPTARIPAIVDNGFVLSESDTIVEYLDEMYPHPPLLPGGAKQRATARYFSRLHDLYVDPAMRALFGHIDPKTRNAEAMKALLKTLNDRLDLFESIAKPKPFLAGKEFSMADCAWAPTLYLADMILDMLGEKEHDYGAAVQAYGNTLAGVPAVKKVMGAYVKAVEAWVAAKKN
jgi:glutathione S-transferase